ncbi:hypothetical protein [Lichenifustis flavocetrariae]|uniref:Transposase n=1 Tax=Lichenifustis flavocetrariae TaxID=2949735 RepID=A0AA42CL76_9HYPH|nr:hypothetical protein [Lichenifustis flavocetrariae]MCW6511329.1 hypothetical protein [Lichenifustis flavocetrariae]
MTQNKGHHGLDRRQVDVIIGVDIPGRQGVIAVRAGICQNGDRPVVCCAERAESAWTFLKFRCAAFGSVRFLAPAQRYR